MYRPAPSNPLEYGMADLPGAPTLDINNLEIVIQKQAIRETMVRNVSLRLLPRTPLCLIGETGCGKTLIAQAILKMLPDGMTATGDIRYQGLNLSDCSPARMRRIWGREIFLFPQEPGAAFNPLKRAKRQVDEVFRFVSGSTRSDPWKRLFRMVGLLPEDGRKYPWQLSGGMSQRLMTAMTLAEPARLIVADEPTKGLDTPVKVITVDLLMQLAASGKSLFIITHDLDLPRQMGGEIAVMYGGMIMEQGGADTVLETPLHPYTRALLSALPKNGLHPIPMQVNGNLFMGGCPFAPRCTKAIPLCFSREPEQRYIHNEKRYIRCHTGHSG